jgi:hypothetical protein
LGLAGFFDFFPGALPQADLLLPHAGWNHRFRSLKFLLDSHVIPANRPEMSPVVASPTPWFARKANESNAFRIHD